MYVEFYTELFILGLCYKMYDSTHKANTGAVLSHIFLEMCTLLKFPSECTDLSYWLRDEKFRKIQSGARTRRITALYDLVYVGPVHSNSLLILLHKAKGKFAEKVFFFFFLVNLVTSSHHLLWAKLDSFVLTQQ